ncbi:uncharacterized protein LOC131929443 [Physella acuta]|uniref:uncharacterized protein LOC131929443 n=1 Tax=Physella acuta TaxID=109671 RepID=UPI0027DC5B2C|nr:uncharacterized protein LOC131929443 [Physella acuta]XP_059141636.1 uncharacterized protein LOC131929443 [Physella acuta]XP_059141638.1 uncharacterized protein LOC131929443 [Physella acuta]XP_059141639.1 uncharacterized protein LOC131929443 [Physella acuta]
MLSAKEHSLSYPDVDKGGALMKCIMAPIIKWKKQWILIVIVALSLVVFYLMSALKLSNVTIFSQKFEIQEQHSYSVWPDFKKNSPVDSVFFKSMCVSNAEYSITGLVDIKKQWAKSKNRYCQALYDKFASIFTITARKAQLSIPEPFKPKVKGWLANNEELFNEVYNQDVIHIISEFTHEHTIFNPLRDKRPVSPPKESEESYFNTMLKESAESCDFCKFKDFTAEHTFGRVESKHAFSASNIFKVDTLHAILALKKHDPIHWNLEEFLDLFELVNTWIAKANHNYSKARFPGVIWDVLPKCGASQVHPHLHVVLDFERHHGVQETWRRGAQEYYSIHKSNYFSDLVDIYTALNLTVKYGSAVAFASLVPKKDHEVVVISENPDTDFYTLLFFVLRGFIDDLHKMCFSLGIGLPALNTREGRLPAYARVITRGYITDIRADMSSLELYLATNVNIDPYKTIEVVRDSVRQRDTTGTA